MALDRSCSCSPKPLGKGKKYHCSILYNHYEGPHSGIKGDQKLAWTFLKEYLEKLSQWEYDSVMYHDKARPGSNIFDNLFNMVKESEKIVVLLTPEFLRNGWHKYSGQASMKNLLEKQEAYTTIIPIAINMEKENIPENFGLSLSAFIFTNYTDKADEGFWDKVKKAMACTELHYEQNIHLHSELCIASSTANNDNSSLEVDEAADGGADREEGRGINAGMSNEVVAENPVNSSPVNHSRENDDDGYLSDTSVHSPQSNNELSIDLRGTNTDRPTLKDTPTTTTGKDQLNGLEENDAIKSTNSSNSASADRSPKWSPQMTQEHLLQPVSPEEALENSDLQVDGHSPRSVTCNANTPQKSGYTELPQGPGEVQKGNSKATTNLKEDGVPSKPFTSHHSASANGVPKSLVYRMISWLWEQFGYMNSG